MSLYQFQPLGFPQIDSHSFDEITEFLRVLFISTNDNKQLSSIFEQFSEGAKKFKPVLIQGGSHVVIAIKFSLSNNLNYILKIYKIKLPELILHCLSSSEFDQRINLAIIDQQEKIGIRTLPIIGIGNLSLNNHLCQFMIQEYSSYKPIKNHTDSLQLLQQIIKIGQSVLADGFHFDLAPGNYLASSTDEQTIVTVEYVDLISSRSTEMMILINEIIAKISEKKDTTQFKVII